jgi:hypothetical protein
VKATIFLSMGNSLSWMIRRICFGILDGSIMI